MSARCALLAVLALLFASHASAVERWDLPTAYPLTNYHTENISQFAAAIDKATNGELKITVHPGASLFKGPEIKRAVQGGQAQLGELLISAHANEDPLFGVDSVPFLATSFADAARLWAASRPALATRLESQGLTLLYAVPWPPQGLFSTLPIESGADLRGLKMRAYNPATARLAELAGAQPVTIQAAELAQALATGAVQVNITSGATGYDAKVWEVARLFYDIRAWIPLNIVVANRAALAALPDSLQQAVLAAAATAETRGWQLAESRTAFYLDALREHGMTVTSATPALQADLARFGTTLTAEWLDRAGAGGQAILDAYQP